MRRLVSGMMIALLLIPLLINGNLLGWVYQDNTSQDTKYEVFGPRADRLLLKFYPSQDAAWNALINNETDIADPVLTPEWYDQFTDSSLADQISINQALMSNTLFILDVNNNNNEFLGNPPDPAYTNPVYPNPCSVLGMRKAIAYLCNRTHIVNELLKDLCFGLPAYTCVTPGSPYVHPDINPNGAKGDLCYLYSREQANASLDASGFNLFDSEGWRIWNATNQRVVLKFFIRNDASTSAQARYAAGNFIADELEACGVKVERTYGGPLLRNQIVLEQKNFHLYTGGWINIQTLDSLVLWSIDSYSHPGRCNNYDGCNNTEFNEASRIATYPADENEAKAAGLAAQEIFAENVLSVPLWGEIYYIAMNRRYVGSYAVPDGEDLYEGQYWDGVSPLDLNGFVIPSSDYWLDEFSSLNMHPRGFPVGDGEHVTIRYGFGNNDVSYLNPLYSYNPTDDKIMGFIGYESLLKRDPYNCSHIVPWIAKNYEVGSYTNPITHEKCSNISFSLRTDVSWSDGEPFTADDVYFTLFELPKILAHRGLNEPVMNWENYFISNFRIIDPYNFEIMMNNTCYWNLFGAMFSRILPEHIWRSICETGDPTTFQPDPDMVATGPWRITEYVEGDHILMAPNPLFFKREPVDCIAGIQSAEAKSNRIPPNTDVEFNAKIINQCYNETADVTVQIYVNNELRNSTQLVINEHSEIQLGPFQTGSLQKGIHEIKVVCTPNAPSWMTPFQSQYTMPVYATYTEDLNLDYYVNGQDSVVVCNAFASCPGDARWDPRADLYVDKRIDARDVVLVQMRASQTEWLAPQPQSGLARLIINPDFAAFSADDTFNVTVSIANVVDLAGYQFTLEYDTGALDLVNADPQWIFPSIWYSHINDSYSSAVGKYFHECTALNPQSPFSGNSLLVTLAFRAVQDGNSAFNLTSTLLADSKAEQIPHVISSDTSVHHDVAILDIRTSKNDLAPGDIVQIQVDVANNGNVLDNFWVSVYADTETTTIGDEILIGTQTTALPGPSSATLHFSWNTSEATPGNLTISARAQIVSGDANATNNILSDGVVQVLPNIHDVAIVDVVPSQKAVYVGESMHVDVGVRSQGNLLETPNITLYADINTTIIGDEAVIGKRAVSIERFSSVIETFDWDTIGLTGGNYTLTAVAEPLPGEVSLGDNNGTDGIVQLFETVPCPDVNVTCPAAMTVNPSIFTYDPNYQARIIGVGNVSILSTGFEGDLRVVGSRNETIRLCVDKPDVDAYTFSLPKFGEVQVPLWLMFQPETHWGTYNGTYTLQLTVCGTHRRYLTIIGIDITVCQNGAYIVNNNTATFTWNLTGGSLVYLEAETDLPPGWTYSVDPPIGAFFETPQIVTVNITAPADAEEGEMGRVTLRAFKNATGAMIWQFVYFASTDNKPPTIESVETPIFSPDGYLLFNTIVKDPSGINEVLLHYSVDGGTWHNTTMHWAAGDTFNSTRYTVQELFGTSPKTVQYYLTVADWLGNQTSTETRTILLMNDIAVTELLMDKTIVCEGYGAGFKVTIANQGSLPLSFFNLAIYANSTLMATQPILNLQNGTSITANFSVVLPKGNYTITAFATCLPDETNTANNAHCSTVVVTTVGDINADGKVDVKDVYKVALAYGTSLEGPNPPGRTYSPNCDINNDYEIDVKDYYIVCKHYGEVDP